jgi:hypothetical protein
LWSLPCSLGAANNRSKVLCFSALRPALSKHGRSTRFKKHSYEKRKNTTVVN